MAKLLCLVLLLALSQVSDAYKILVVYPLVSRSHNILGQGYVRHLLDAGHEVTFITPFPMNNTSPKYHEVDLSANVQLFEGVVFTLQQLIDKEVSTDFTSLIPKFIEISRMTLENENLQAFLSDTTQNFDVVITEWLFNDINAAFATVFNCPLIWSWSVEPHWLMLSRIHEASSPAYSPDIMSTAVPPFTFMERAGSLLRQILINAVIYFYLDPAEKNLYKEFFGPALAKRGRELPSYDEVVFNASFLLTNSHPAMSQAISVPPNTKEIGGYYINSKVKPLPADLQKLMDEAEHGVIYFSMGSNLKSKDFPDAIKQGFLRVLGGVKQTVIWKFEEDLPNKPKNVHIVQWAPQQSILAHPNIRLFITHGGLLSTTETIFFGVPTIVMPCAADQHLNAVRAVKKGYALMIDLSYEMADDMKLAIDEILNNPKYMEKVQTLSKIYHDRLVPPSKELVHWVEHVVRTGGALHLHSPALMLSWYQKMYLDLATLVLVVLYGLKWLFSKLFQKKAPISNKKKTN